MGEQDGYGPQKMRIASLPPKGIPPSTAKEVKMAGDKIRVSWDEVQSVRVDAELKQQEALSRAQQHTQQQPFAARPFPMPSKTNASILYNALFYMTLFGLVGGILAWGMGEITQGNLEQFDRYSREEKQIIDRHFRGELSIQAANQAIQRLQERFRGNPYLDIVLNKTTSQVEMETRFKGRANKDEMIWLTLVGTILALFLAVAEPSVSRNYHGIVINGAVGAVLGLVGGFVLSLFINSLYHAMGGGNQADFTRHFFARVVGWSIAGLFLAIGPGIVLRNFKRTLIGLGGGLLGGLIGGALFDPVAKLTESAVASRLVGIAAIGGFAGLGTGIIESVAKTGWLQVRAGLLAGKQFILYRNPTAIGSSPPQCEIYLFKEPQVSPRHALVHLVPGGVELEDQQSGAGTFVNGQPIARVRLRAGDQIQIGTTCFVFHEKAKSPA